VPTPGKYGQGLKGLPTPDTTPDILACRVFRVPANDDWLGLLDGAMYQLEKPQNYYLWGSLTPDETADTWHEIIMQSYLDSMTGNCATTDDEPPYWDGTSGENADNEHPADTGFPWYEDLAWEFIEGFVATLVGVPAAHSYVSVTKKLRLVYLKRSDGGTFNVEIDGDAVAQVDTYSASESIGYVDVVVP